MTPRAQIECKIKRCVYLVHFSCEKNTIREQDGLNHHYTTIKLSMLDNALDSKQKKRQIYQLIKTI